MLWYIHKQYEEDQQLNFCGQIIHVLIYAIHCMVLVSSGWRNTYSPPPMNKYGTVGLIIAGIGVIMVLYSMDFLCKFGTWVGSDVSGLRTDGIYAYSRNPQFVFYFVVLVGISIPWWNWYVLVSLVFYFILVYAMVTIEERHLTKIFGAEYLQYCQRVPRFVGIPSK